MTVERVIIDEVIISAHVNAKINAVHNIDRLDVDQAISRRSGTRWAMNEDGTPKLLMKGETDGGRQLRIVLYPTNMPGVWNLATAFPIR